MGGLVSNLFLPIKAAYIRLFEINKYLAVLVLSVTTTLLLFVLIIPFDKFTSKSEDIK